MNNENEVISLEFDLPVGAMIGGVRHLGGGKFLGKIHRDVGMMRNSPYNAFPIVIRHITDDSENVASGDKIPVVQVKDDFDDKDLHQGIFYTDIGQDLANVLNRQVCLEQGIAYEEKK